MTSMPVWVTETAEAFWLEAGGFEEFPRSLRRPIANALPVTLVFLPHLGVSRVTDWMSEQRVMCRLDVDDRKIRACLVARGGQGIVFIDGADSEEEQRFSIAHELAHFLRDYWHPRSRVSARLGQGILEVLDGRRSAREAERAHALLAGMSIEFHVHLMERTESGSFADNRIMSAEMDADLLAFELLAPVDVLVDRIEAIRRDDRCNSLLNLLGQEFGLPRGPAMQYAKRLLSDRRPSESLLRKLGVST